MFLGSIFLAAAAALLVQHASAIRAVRETGLPTYVAVPALERRLEVLREQVEISQLQRSLAEGSVQEMMKAFVIPDAAEIDRVLGFIEHLRNHFERGKMLRGMSAVRVDGGDAENELRSHVFSFDVELTEEALRQWLDALDLSGFVAASDALTDGEVRRLLRVTEEENPASIAVIEHFLSTPLLRYALEPKPFEEHVRRSFASVAFAQSFNDLLQHSTLADARQFLASALGQSIARERFWPMRFLMLDQVTLAPKEVGWVKASLELRAYSRIPHP